MNDREDEISILKSRLAAGEITIDQYNELKSILGKNRDSKEASTISSIEEKEEELPDNVLDIKAKIVDVIFEYAQLTGQPQNMLRGFKTLLQILSFILLLWFLYTPMNRLISSFGLNDWATVIFGIITLIIMPLVLSKVLIEFLSKTIHLAWSAERNESKAFLDEINILGKRLQSKGVSLLMVPEGDHIFSGKVFNGFSSSNELNENLIEMFGGKFRLTFRDEEGASEDWEISSYQKRKM
ncbi:MAG: SHOCT domain-containing protein [Maricaulaceae bacterium]